MTISFEASQYEVAREIGFDVALVHIDDKEAHLDAPYFLFSIAGLIIGAWCQGFLESAATELGDKTWKGLKKKVQAWLDDGPKQQVDKKSQELGQQVIVTVRETYVLVQSTTQNLHQLVAREETMKIIEKFNLHQGDNANRIIEKVESQVLRDLGEEGKQNNVL